MTPTQDELRQLYEAGASFVNQGAKMWFPQTGSHQSPKKIEAVYSLALRENETLETALVGYATQLLRDLFPNETRNVRCDGRNGWLYDNIKYDNYPSLVAMIVDLARIKKEREKVHCCMECGIELPQELWQWGYCGPRCEMLSRTTKAPERPTADSIRDAINNKQPTEAELDMLCKFFCCTREGLDNFLVTAPESVTAPTYDWSVRERQELDKQLDQLRADVREIASAMADFYTDNACQEDTVHRLRTVAKRFIDKIIDNAAKEKV